MSNRIIHAKHIDIKDESYIMENLTFGYLMCNRYKAVVYLDYCTIEVDDIYSWEIFDIDDFILCVFQHDNDTIPVIVEKGCVDYDT